MADIQASLSFGGVQASPDRLMHLVPGTMLQGAVIVQTSRGITCHGIFLRAAWRTRGRGDTDVGRPFNLLIFQGHIPPGGYTLPFQFQVPQEPWSYNGHYISISWEMIVECDLGIFQKPKFTYPFLLRPA